MLQYIWLYICIHLEKAMATHSSTLAWKISWAEEPGRLQSMGLLRVGHDWATSLSLLTFMQWRRKWQPTPVFLPGESQGRGSLVGCHLWSCTDDWSMYSMYTLTFLIKLQKFFFENTVPFTFPQVVYENSSAASSWLVLGRISLLNFNHCTVCSDIPLSF